MFRNFFEARDAWDAELLSKPDGERKLQAAHAVFRVLLEHTIFDRKSPAYGWVAEGKNKLTSQATMSKLIGCARRQTVGDALVLLETSGMIERHPVRTGKPGSKPDRIKITWEPLWADTESAENEHSRDEDPPSVRFPDTRKRKANILESAENEHPYASKKGLEELSTKNAEGRSPSGGMSPTPPNPKTTPPTPLMGAEEARAHIEEELPAIAAQLYSDRPLDEAVRLVREQIMFPGGDHRRRLPFLRQLEELRSLGGEGR